jgi:hypothetical protein
MNRSAGIARWTLLGLGLAWAAAGCGLMDLGPWECLDTRQCPTGYRCDPDTWRCEPIPIAEDLVHFELRPLAGSGSTLTQVSLELTDPSVDSLDLQLELAPLLSLKGSVPSPFAAGGVAGGLTASLPPGFGGRGLTWSSSVPADGRFELGLAPGRYRVLFSPANRAEFPQLCYEQAELTNADALLDLAYPGPYLGPEQLDQQDPMLLVKVQVLASEDAPTPVADMLVEGLTDQGLRTSLGTPDAQGVAYLRLPAVRRLQGDRWTWQWPASLELTIRPASEGLRLPTVVYPGLSLAGPDLGTFYVGELPPARRVSGRVITSRGDPVSGCQLHFLLAQLGQGSLKHVLEADPQGAFSASLPTGSYLVRVIPPLSSSSSIAVSSLELSEDRADLFLEAPTRPRVTGLVRDHQNNPVPHLDLAAHRVSDWSGIQDGASRTYEGQTDAGGLIDLALDPGQYELELLPDEASGLPRHVVRAIFVTQDSELSPAQTRLPAPSLVRGHVFNRGGVPQCGVGLDAFRQDEQGLLRVGQTVSGNPSGEGCSGAFSLVLPDLSAR